MLLPPPPVIISQPVSFQTIGVHVGANTSEIQVFAGQEKLLTRALAPGPRRVSVTLPVGRSRVRVRAVGPGGESWSRPRVVAVLPRSARALGRFPGRLDPIVQARIARVVGATSPIMGVYVHDLRTNCAAGVNAGARCPGASTLKLGILIEALRRGYGQTAAERRLFDLMTIPSEDRPANQVLTAIGDGSQERGGARVTETLRRLGLRETVIRRGYLLVDTATVPITTIRQPSLYTNLITTPYELARLVVAIHRGARGRGGIRRVGISPAQARSEILGRLIRSGDRNKIIAAAPPGVVAFHKSGFTTQVKHDSGIIYLPRGPLVIVAMTWSSGGVSDSVGSRAISEVARIAVARLGRSRACR